MNENEFLILAECFKKYGGEINNYESGLNSIIGFGNSINNQIFRSKSKKYISNKITIEQAIERVRIPNVYNDLCINTVQILPHIFM